MNEHRAAPRLLDDDIRTNDRLHATGQCRGEDAAVHSIAATVERLAGKIADRVVLRNRDSAVEVLASAAELDDRVHDLVTVAAVEVLLTHFTGNLPAPDDAAKAAAKSESRARAARSVFAAACVPLEVDEADGHCWQVRAKNQPAAEWFLFWPAASFWKLPKNGGAQGVGAPALVRAIGTALLPRPAPAAPDPPKPEPAVPAAADPAGQSAEPSAPATAPAAADAVADLAAEAQPPPGAT
jgi:hypothetical protein